MGGTFIKVLSHLAVFNTFLSPSRPNEAPVPGSTWLPFLSQTLLLLLIQHMSCHPTVSGVPTFTAALANLSWACLQEPRL